MRLARNLEAWFGAGARRRGEAYARAGHVVVLEGSATQVLANVRGTERRPYRVTLAWDGVGGVLRVSCTCPYFGGASQLGPACKHLWAAVLVADQKGLLAEATTQGGPLGLRSRAESSSDSRGGDHEDDTGHNEDEADGGADEDGDDDWFEGDLSEHGDSPYHVPRGGPERGGVSTSWRGWIETIRSFAAEPARRPGGAHDVGYFIQPRTDEGPGSLTLEVGMRARKAGARWRPLELWRCEQTMGAEDREILALLGGLERDMGWSFMRRPINLPWIFSLIGPAWWTRLLPRMCATGRCYPGPLQLGGESPLRWDGDSPWELHLTLTEGPDGGLELGGRLQRLEDTLHIEKIEWVLSGGLLCSDGQLALTVQGTYPWWLLLRRGRRASIASADTDAFLGELVDLPSLPKLELPEHLRFEEVYEPPRPRLVLRAPPTGAGDSHPRAEVIFAYGEAHVEAERPDSRVADVPRRRLYERDRPAEEAALAALGAVGFRELPPSRRRGGQTRSIAPRRVPSAISALLEAGWHVEADGKVYRRGGSFRARVKSGVDWLELDGVLEIDGAEVALPRLLEAVTRGDGLVTLDDGSVGLLPVEWLERWGLLGQLGHRDGDRLKFRPSQAALLDALLGEDPGTRWDATARRVRQDLAGFDGIKPAVAPRSFRGTLRPYQAEGLGWLRFLRRFGLGGCLADDMGLGKTVQVLALLATRRGSGRRAPTLVVVPRSVIFNWREEAARFTPHLCVLEHAGPDRIPPGPHFEDYDLVLITYGTLRRDIDELAKIHFGTVVLDEAQAIKNAATAVAKAARRLQADHRLALSGTPVENHVGEIWSLFEFLNPGMLGSARAFRGLAVSAEDPGSASAALLGSALRPFLLRRTKRQVAPELPERVEQTLHCELLPAERRLYDELRDHYRRSLLKRVDRDGVGRSSAHVLEALLRLRQAACHPGLLDADRKDTPSAKLSLLGELLENVREEGHKALVFSQFTKLLALVRAQLDLAGVPYEYLDGRTRDRQARVARFQDDPRCPLFLISLKAGGLGLNLTAGSYVFLLDPWWNPAVEAQAIDRAHRIGQDRTVFAYRLLSRDTVEEKVAELQEHKRELAGAILGAGGAPLRDLTREDLERLLS